LTPLIIHVTFISEIRSFKHKVLKRISLQESQIEQKLISKLEELKYTYRPDIRDKATLERNFRDKFEALNCVHQYSLFRRRIHLGSFFAPWIAMSDLAKRKRLVDVLIWVPLDHSIEHTCL